MVSYFLSLSWFFLPDRKGNSLFAEVDDQRQEMKSLLAAQKNQFLQMKKLYTESEYEIRKLKREQAAMHKELQRCITIFLNADKFYKGLYAYFTKSLSVLKAPDIS